MDGKTGKSGAKADGSPLLALVIAAGARAEIRFLEFFAAAIRNPHTRRAYARATADFLVWCERHGVVSPADVRPLHVATWIEVQAHRLAANTLPSACASCSTLIRCRASFSTGTFATIRTFA